MVPLWSRLLHPLLFVPFVALASSSTSPRLLQARGPSTLGYSYFGCWTDVGRTIDAQYLSVQAMTTEKCIEFCDGKGYAYAGTEYYNQCCEFSH